jgi:hypothetical protein
MAENTYDPAFLTGSRREVMEVVANARLATEDGAVVFTVRLTDRDVRLVSS